MFKYYDPEAGRGNSKYGNLFIGTPALMFWLWIFWIGSLWGKRGGDWCKEASMSHNAVIYKAPFFKFPLIIRADVCLAQQTVFQAIWYAFLHINGEKPLSGDQAGRLGCMMDNFCFATRSLVVFSFFFIYYFCFIYEPVSSCFVTLRKNPTNYFHEKLISLIADASNCARWAVFESSLIISNTKSP